MQPVSGQPNQAQTWEAPRKKAIIIIIFQIVLGIATQIAGFARLGKNKDMTHNAFGPIAMVAGITTLGAGCGGINAVRYFGNKTAALVHAAVTTVAIIFSITAFGFACKDLSLAGAKVCKRSFFSSYDDCESFNVVPAIFLFNFLLGGIAIGGYRLILYYKEIKSGVNLTLPTNISQPAQYGAGLPPGDRDTPTWQPYPLTETTAYPTSGLPSNVSQPAQFAAGSAAVTAVPSGASYIPTGQPYPPTGTAAYPTAGQPYLSTPAYRNAQTAYPPPSGPVCSQQHPNLAQTAPRFVPVQPQQMGFDSNLTDLSNLPPQTSYSKADEEVTKW